MHLLLTSIPQNHMKDRDFPQRGKSLPIPRNAPVEILSRNPARVASDGFLRDLPVSTPYNLCKFEIKFGKLQKERRGKNGWMF